MQYKIKMNVKSLCFVFVWTMLLVKLMACVLRDYHTLCFSGQYSRMSRGPNIVEAAPAAHRVRAQLRRCLHYIRFLKFFSCSLQLRRRNW